MSSLPTMSDEPAAGSRVFATPNDKIVFSEQVCVLKEHINTNLFIHLVIAPVFLFLVWEHTAGWLLTAWTTLLLISLAFRWQVARRCDKTTCTADSAPRWALLFLVGVMATGSAWGMAGVIMEYHSLEGFHGLIIFILAGLAAGAISTNSAVFPVYLAFILPVLLPLDLMFLIKGDNVHYIMAALTTFFLAMMLVVSSRYNKVIKQAITQKFENQQILDELSISEQRFHDVALCSSDWIWEVDSEARYIYSAGRVKEILGYSPEELLGKTPFELMPDDEAERVGKIFRKICAQQEPIVDLEWNMFKNTEDGERIWILSNGVPVLDSSGNLEGYRGVDKDITERKQLEERLGHMATHDPLTGLYNRGELDRLLLEEVQRSARYSHPLSVLMIDVDHFKGINDTYGHQVGDEVLRNLAQMLTSFLRAMDHAGRYGGEEFLITLPETTATEAQVVAERIRKGIADSSVALSSGLDISFTVSIGVATHPDHGVDEDSVLSAADEALYRAKNSGRNRVCVAQARM